MVSYAVDAGGRMPPREECVLRYVLEQRAALHPDRTFIRLGDGTSIGYGQFLKMVERTAAGLASLGVRQDDTVTVWLPNGVEMIRIWFAINWLGAIYVPINVAYRGNLLAHVIANAGSKIIVASSDLVRRLQEVDRANLETLVVVGGDGDEIEGLTKINAETLDQHSSGVPELARSIEPWDVQSIIFTSGTTGRSKGVVSSYAHMWHMSGREAFYMLDDDDCFLLYGPLFHVGGTLPVVAMLNRGGTVAVAGEFATESFWSSVRATRATFVILLGVMSSFISKRPPAPDDRDHTLKKAMMIPLPDDSRDFAQRFGVTVWTLFNMTEINVPIVSEPNPAVVGTCGKRRPGNDLRIVDEFDCEVPCGKVGELIIRSEAPWALNSGYFRNDEATVRAWRNGWFHTGDGFRCDADGNYFFVDRMKDAIRRRGENISSFEVEVEIMAHPDIRECAVVAVPNEMSEDDVLAIVAPAPSRSIDPVELLDFLRPRLAHFMLPRYIRVLSELPRTPTQKVEKYLLRQQGVAEGTWDREKAGIKIQREKIGS
jgi:crotonobetaine/carnitine-CoA ligase